MKNTINDLIEFGMYTEGTPLKLHLGCGSQYMEGYINIDHPPEDHSVIIPNVNVYADITKDLFFPSNTVDEIRSHHVFEHFNRVEALVQLIKWHGWLKIGGKLIIETPDIMGSVAQLAGPHTGYKERMAVIRHLVGDQSSEWGFHVDQWSKERFEYTLRLLGFEHIDCRETQWEIPPYLANVEVTARKEDEVSVKYQIDKAKELLKDSMVSERETKTYDVWTKQLDEMIQENIREDVL